MKKNVSDQVTGTVLRIKVMKNVLVRDSVSYEIYFWQYDPCDSWQC